MEQQIKDTDRLYRGYGFASEKERREFLEKLQRDKQDIRTGFGSKGIPLSAFREIAERFACGYGVVLEINAEAINYRLVNYGKKEEPIHCMYEAEVRTPCIPLHSIEKVSLVENLRPYVEPIF